MAGADQAGLPLGESSRKRFTSCRRGVHPPWSRITMLRYTVRNSPDATAMCSSATTALSLAGEGTNLEVRGTDAQAESSDATAYFHTAEINTEISSRMGFPAYQKAGIMSSQ